MSKINNFLNTLCILTTIIILILYYWLRMNMLPFMSVFNYVCIFALATTIFSLPDFICYFFPSKNKWYRSSEFYTGILIIFLGTVGIILSKYSALTSYFILPIGIPLAFWEFYNYFRSKNLLTLASGLILMGFIILLFFSRSFVSPLYMEEIILGIAHGDTLFFSSMSNMFSTLGWPSTGLDGSPFVHYHWGSMVLFAGLKSWTGLNTLMFYNFAYPAIFIPLFIKSLFYFLKSLFIYKGIISINLLFAISFLTVLYSLQISGLVYATPLRFENLTISIIFTFLYGGTLLSYITKRNKNNNLFFLYSVIVLLLISSTKISTGVVCLIGMAYLYLRVNRSISNLLFLFIGVLIIATFIYLFIFPERPSPSASLAVRISNLWIASFSFISYLIGALIFILVILKNKSLKNWTEFKLLIKSREYLDLEILFILTISAFIGAIYVSGFGADVYMFCATQFIISIPYLIMFSQKYFDRFAASTKVKTLFLFLLILFSIVSNPDSIRVQNNRITQVNENMLKLTQQQRVLQSFLAELFKIDKEIDKKLTCIYIPETEKWYYESQTERPFGSPMVVPAITGIALIGGVPKSIYTSDIYSHSYYYYKKDGQIQLTSLIDAKERAINKGYTKLIEYQFVDGQLVKQIFDLKKQN